MEYKDIPTLAQWKTDTLVGPPPVPPRPGVIRPLPPLPQRRIPGTFPIDDILKLHDQAFQPMTKANLAMDLTRAIADWQTKNPGKMPEPIAALKRAATIASQRFGATHRHTHVQCIGWAVGCNYDKTTKVIRSDSAKNPDYFCHDQNDSVDALQKVKEMVKAIKCSKLALGAPKPSDATTLKVFMAPEFYFRGVQGAYSPDIVSNLVPWLHKELGSGWDDWLFVFGTAVASIVQEVTYCTKCGYGNSKIQFMPDPASKGTRSDGSPAYLKTVGNCSNDKRTGIPHPMALGAVGAEVQNVALVSYRGASHLVAKEYVSGIDYIGAKVDAKRTGYSSLDVSGPEGGANSAIGSKFDDERMGGCILTVAGLTVGLEVCLDHALASTGQAEWGRASQLASTIQLLLIPSYGMNIEGLHCRVGGIVFNVDGRGKGSTDLVVKGSPAVSNTKPAIKKVDGGRGQVEVWATQPIPA